MADIVNLRQARKAKLRAEREAEANTNRARFGEPAAFRRARDVQDEREKRQLEGHRLEPTRRVEGSADGEPTS
ncbi:MAG: DUF4169 family protein [Chelatococcus sp.]|jgi:hypothetical protein|uniref:DUF4169 family protein n=1 Tax=unclassified Chelatococcus TaxID=2638111 RepID=UPI001BCB3A09|nr:MULTISPECIES: DUF4169 family protein [unclassified Chelatococcus]MBS7737880.1 DUF4169 family protein [Chelatococcus sp. HY11]MBX3538847.1 DUF4169 family protein [Chelatococcus sp.]MBX3546672.1 DUF4169 family protein [Chelatococcus sp.]MCO5079334.1 DUF4169 family protein [Chelatococcus sp.]